VVEQVGRLKERFPRAAKLARISIAQRGRPQVRWQWKTEAIRAALVQDGAYLLKSNYHGWSPEEFWETYMQLTVAEKAFRTLKSELLIRPMWHQYDGRQLVLRRVAWPMPEQARILAALKLNLPERLSPDRLL